MQKIKEIDYLRAFSTLFVLLIHLTSTYLNYSPDSYTYKIISFFNRTLTFVVPCFLFISALVMTYQAKNLEKINWVKFTLKRLSKVLIALILWSAIYLHYLGTINLLTKEKIYEHLLTGNVFYHLYFLPIIIQLYLLFPLIWLGIKKISKIKVSLPVSFSICIVLGILFQTFFSYTFRLNLFKTFPYFYCLIFTYSLPIIMGIWIGFNYNEVKNFFNKYFLILLLVLTILTHPYKEKLFISPIYWVSITLTLTYLLRYIKNSKILNEISKKSFIIYLSHPLFMSILDNELNYQMINITNSVFANYCINLFIRFAIILTTSYLLALIWSLIKKIIPKKKIS